RVAESQLALAHAQRESTHARIAADAAMFSGDSAARPQAAEELKEAAICAERVERKTTFVLAQANLAQGEQAWLAAKENAASNAAAKDAATKAESHVKKAQTAVDPAGTAVQ